MTRRGFFSEGSFPGPDGWETCKSVFQSAIHEHEAKYQPISGPNISRGATDLQTVQITGLVNGGEWSLLGKLPLQSGLGNQVEGQCRATEEFDRAEVILCRPFRDRSFFPTYPALTWRALDCSVPTGLV